MNDKRVRVPMSGLGLGRVEMALWMPAFEVLVPIVHGLELAAIDGTLVVTRSSSAASARH
jgi:hypothetical protein